MDDLISRRDAIDALWKALYDYEDKTEKQFLESEELNTDDWFLHRIFVQNMSGIDLQTIINLPSADAVEVVRCHKCIHWDEDTVRRNSNDATWWNEAVCRKYSDDMWEVWKDADWFCADGERKTDG